jgi:hypothetical protein
MGQNVEWEKRRLGHKFEDIKKNLDWDKTSKNKKRRLEKTSTVKTSTGKKRRKVKNLD